MADEARLNDLLDLVEQARAEGDTATEQKAIAAYKRESSPLPPVYGPSINITPQMLLAQRYAEAPARVGEMMGITEENTRNGAAQFAGPLEVAAQAGSGLAGAVAGGLAGIGQGIKNQFSPGMPAGDRVRQVQGAMTYQPRTGAGAGLSSVLGLPGRAITAGSEYLGGKTTDATGNPALGAAVETVGEFIPALVGAKLSLPKSGPKPTGKYVDTRFDVPTTEVLRNEKNLAYKEAEAAGVVIRPESTQRVVEIFDTVAKKENLGRLPPKLKEAADILRERVSKKEPLTLMDADKARQLINDALKSTDAGDRRLAKTIKAQYDEYLRTLKPEDTFAGDSAKGVAALEKARSLHQRLSNSEMLDSMERKADLKGEAKYTQAGSEHALRQEFLKLVTNDKKMRMLTEEQKAALRKVAAPGATANLVRNLGKIDPSRGGMAAALNTVIGGGGGAVLGGLLGGPVGAGSGAIAGQAGLAALANIANRSALKNTKANAAKAREVLVGRGLRPMNEGLLSKAGTSPRNAATTGRSPQQLRAEIEALDAEVFRLSAMGPAASTVRKSVESELARLQRELAAAEALGE